MHACQLSVTVLVHARGVCALESSSCSVLSNMTEGRYLSSNILVTISFKNSSAYLKRDDGSSGQLLDGTRTYECNVLSQNFEIFSAEYRLSLTSPSWFTGTCNMPDPHSAIACWRIVVLPHPGGPTSRAYPRPVARLVERGVHIIIHGPVAQWTCDIDIYTITDLINALL